MSGPCINGQTIKEWVPFLDFTLSFSVEHLRGCLSLPSTLPGTGICCHEKNRHKSSVSSSFPLVVPTCIHLPLLCILRALVVPPLSADLASVASDPNALLLCLCVADLSSFPPGLECSSEFLHLKREPRKPTWVGNGVCMHSI